MMIIYVVYEEEWETIGRKYLYFIHPNLWAAHACRGKFGSECCKETIEDLDQEHEKDM